MSTDQNEDGSARSSSAVAQSCAQAEEAEPEHTPGPWYISRKDKRLSPVQVYHRPGDHAYYPICSLNMDLDEARANGRLIHAAPDLLAACKALTEAVDPDSGYADHTAAVEASRKAEKAISRAEGEA